jgi:hypothetical protein
VLQSRLVWLICSVSVSQPCYLACLIQADTDVHVLPSQLIHLYICYAATAVVLKGQGLQILSSSDGAAPVRGAVDCWLGSTGMAQDTVMFNARPCDTCPRSMTTLQPLSSNRSDCRAVAGYTAVVGSQPPSAAVACDIGYYKPTIGNEACTMCPSNTSTLSTASISIANCTGEMI